MGVIPKLPRTWAPSLSIAPYGLFDGRQGQVQISVGSEKLWATLARTFGIDASRPEFASNAERVRNREKVIEEVENIFSEYDAETLLTKLKDAGVPAGKVRTLDEVYEWGQVRSQGLVIDVEHRILGNISLPGPPLRFFDTPPTSQRRRSTCTVRPRS